jgi:hypothetical protein
VVDEAAQTGGRTSIQALGERAASEPALSTIERRGRGVQTAAWKSEPTDNRWAAKREDARRRRTRERSQLEPKGGEKSSRGPPLCMPSACRRRHHPIKHHGALHQRRPSSPIVCERQRHGVAQHTPARLSTAPCTSPPAMASHVSSTTALQRFLSAVGLCGLAHGVRDARLAPTLSNAIVSPPALDTGWTVRSRSALARLNAAFSPGRLPDSLPARPSPARLRSFVFLACRRCLLQSPSFGQRQAAGEVHHRCGQVRCQIQGLCSDS